jgi:peptidyl-prolyl cis-trans isomerase C
MATRNPLISFGTRSRRLYHALPSTTRYILHRALKVAVGVIVTYIAIGLLMAIPIYRGSENWTTKVTEHFYPYPAMNVNGTIISLKRYRSEVMARQTYASSHNLGSTDEQARQFVIDQLVSRTLYSQELARNKITITDGDVDQKLQDIYTQVGGQDKLITFLNQNYGDQTTLDQFRTWVKESLIEAAVKQQLLVHVTVRHILIAVPTDASQPIIDAAKAKLLDIKSKIPNANAFGDIAKQYSEDIASKDKGGELGKTARGDSDPIFSADFEQAIFTLPVNQISDPIRSKYGWHLVLVESHEGTIDSSAPQLLEKLKSEGGVRVFVKAKY